MTTILCQCSIRVFLPAWTVWKLLAFYGWFVTADANSAVRGLPRVTRTPSIDSLIPILYNCWSVGIFHLSLLIQIDLGFWERTFDFTGFCHLKWIFVITTFWIFLFTFSVPFLFICNGSSENIAKLKQMSGLLRHYSISTAKHRYK